MWQLGRFSKIRSHMWMGQWKWTKWTHKIWPHFSNLLHHNYSSAKAIEVKFLLSINNLIANSLRCVQYLFTESKCCTQNSRYLLFCDMVYLCQLGPFSLAQSHMWSDLWKPDIMAEWNEHMWKNLNTKHYKKLGTKCISWNICNNLTKAITRQWKLQFVKTRHHRAP